MKQHTATNCEPLCSWCGERISKGSRYWANRIREGAPGPGLPQNRQDFHEACVDAGFKAWGDEPERWRRVEYDHGADVAYGLPYRATLLHERVPWPKQD